jgi:enolase
VVTASGARGVAMCTAGISVGQHEVEFAYDGGSKWRGKGVTRAVNAVNELIAPALRGLDASNQSLVDGVMLNIDGPDAKARLGGNATAAVSAAVLKAGAAALDLPLYRHVGGANACALPVPGVDVLNGADRYGGGQRSGDKPSHEFVCFGFGTFSEAAYAGWDVVMEWRDIVRKRFGVRSNFSEHIYLRPGQVQDDRELWRLMAEAIAKRGYEGRIGLQIDAAAGTYYEKDRQKYVGLFSAVEKTRDDMIEYYARMVKDFPFVIFEDPLDEDDYEGHAILTREVGIQITGDDLFTTNPERVAQGIKAGAANCVLLKVNQIGSISEAFDMVKLAYRHGYGVQPCASRGEGEAIVDYTVGLMCGTMRGGAVGAAANRFMEIEAELGPQARFLGRSGFSGKLGIP